MKEEGKIARKNKIMIRYQKMFEVYPTVSLKQGNGWIKSKLMRLGSPNLIDVVESKSESEFDRRLSSIQISRFNSS